MVSVCYGNSNEPVQITGCACPHQAGPSRTSLVARSMNGHYECVWISVFAYDTLNALGKRHMVAEFENDKYHRAPILTNSHSLSFSFFMTQSNWTASCLIIGDEILSGKTQDSNSYCLAQFLFELGIELKRIEVVPDDENAIGIAIKQHSAAYDFVFTSGGIGKDRNEASPNPSLHLAH
ncbi:hypothetical protein [Absidia glauca]|uniref:MoaB/Mog domain-containing protein n=1 Tax=Absidia glauca TaxID=4829 RepID=A0A163IWV6_ABSGL|nr:hypothetical protein [Absidia glauca]